MSAHAPEPESGTMIELQRFRKMSETVFAPLEPDFQRLGTRLRTLAEGQPAGPTTPPSLEGEAFLLAVVAMARLQDYPDTEAMYARLWQMVSGHCLSNAMQEEELQKLMGSPVGGTC